MQKIIGYQRPILFAVDTKWSSLLALEKTRGPIIPLDQTVISWNPVDVNESEVNSDRPKYDSSAY